MVSYRNSHSLPFFRGANIHSWAKCIRRFEDVKQQCNSKNFMVIPAFDTTNVTSAYTAAEGASCLKLRRSTCMWKQFTCDWYPSDDTHFLQALWSTPRFYEYRLSLLWKTKNLRVSWWKALTWCSLHLNRTCWWCLLATPFHCRRKARSYGCIPVKDTVPILARTLWPSACTHQLHAVVYSKPGLRNRILKWVRCARHTHPRRLSNVSVAWLAARA